MAKVIQQFTGVVDGKVHPVLHNPGDEVHGELARVAIAEGWAEGTPVNELGLRTDGPTLDEYVAAGYPADRYPPRGYTDKRTRAELDAAFVAFAAREAAASAALTATDRLRDAGEALVAAADGLRTPAAPPPAKGKGKKGK